MLFEIEKPRLLYFKQHFDTTTRTSTLFLFYHDNKADHFPLCKNEVSKYVTSYLNKT